MRRKLVSFFSNFKNSREKVHYIRCITSISCKANVIEGTSVNVPYYLFVPIYNAFLGFQDISIVS